MTIQNLAMQLHADRQNLQMLFDHSEPRYIAQFNQPYITKILVDFPHDSLYRGFV